MPQDAASLETKVRAFFDAWATDFETFCDSFFGMMTDDCVVVQSGIPDVTGPGEMRALLEAGRAAHGIETVRIDLPHLVINGDTVISERIDYLQRGDRSVAATVPVVGVMEFKDGRIAAWREYFDSRLMDVIPGSRGTDA